MITCHLGDKTYTVDKVTGRVLREMDEASRMMQMIRYSALIAASEDMTAEQRGEALKDIPTIAEALDAMVKWFCVLFGNQFTPDDVYDNYPADDVVYDLSLAITAVQQNMSRALSEFPIPAAQKTPKPRKQKAI